MSLRAVWDAGTDACAERTVTSSGRLGAATAALGAGLENGTLRPVVGREFPLAEAAEAHKAVLGPGAYGKIVLVP